MRRAYKIIAWVVGLTIAIPLLTAGLAALAFLYGPADTLRAQLVASMEYASGRRIEIDGPLERSLWPAPLIRTGAMRVYDAGTQEGAAPRFTADEVVATAAYLPAFGGRLELSEIVLTRPSADFASANEAAANTPKSVLTASGAEEEFELRDLFTAARGGFVHLSSLRIIGGAVRYRDPATDKVIEIKDLELDYASPLGGDGVQVKGAAQVAGAPATLELSVADLDAVAAGDVGKMTGAFSGGGVVLSVDGSAALGDGAERPLILKGDASFVLTEDQRESGWLQALLPPELAPLLTADVKGAFDVSPEQFFVAFSGAADFNGERTDARLNILAGPGWADGRTAADVSLALVNPFLDAGYEGRLGFTEQGGPLLDGSYQVKAQDFRAFNRWATASDERELFAGAKLIERVDVSGAARLVENQAEGSIEGAARYNGSDASIEGKIVGGLDWRSGGATQTELKLSAPELFELSWSGTLALDETPEGERSFAAVSGDLSASSPDILKLRAWLQLPPPAANVTTAAFTGRIEFSASQPPVAPGEIALDAAVQEVVEEALSEAQPSAPRSAAPEEIETATAAQAPTLDEKWNGSFFELADAVLSVDGAATEISARADVRDGRLVVQADLKGGPLDLTPASDAAADLGVLEREEAADGGLFPDATNVAPVGWSTESADLTPIRWTDAQVALDLAGLRTGYIELGPLAGALTIQDQRLSADLPTVEAFGGKAEARGAVDMSTGAPAHTFVLTLLDADLNQVLTWYEMPNVMVGKTNIVLDVAAAGSSEAELYASLSGTGGIVASNGAMFLIDFKSISGGGLAELLGAKQVERGVTPYDKMTATVTMSEGIATNLNLRFVGPVISFDGDGRINIGARTIDYTITPTRFGEKDVLDEIIGKAFPIILVGSWDALKIGTTERTSSRRLPRNDI